ncbi:Mediator of RNA polymerase II transcription subunit 22b [Camellia lanceoleosa]|uniref:Mediator of RNA polymerase II transcription subunit 22b n=1 Tax=Camellia lanceoleosa TaxID=1840588 RepID=A0ACC0HCS5_9ERIC|nr:Mediator of RNA polymerase II transcription subunit 22b [Camellia lanceoleosa]
MNKGGVGGGSGSGGGGGPTSAAAAAAAQKQKTLLQRVDNDIGNIVDNFSYLVNVARVNDPAVRNSQETFMMEMCAARMNSVIMPSSSRARARDIPSTSRAGTSKGGAGLVSPISPTYHHPGWPDMPTELTGWRYGTSYPIPIEPPMPDHRYVSDPDSPLPPREYIDEMLGLVASLEGMVLRREAQLSIMGVQMPPVYTQPQAGPSRPSRGVGPSRPSRGAGPSRPSRGVRGGESSHRRRAHIMEEEASEEEEAVDRQSETSADREEGSGPGSDSGGEVEEDLEDDSSDSDGAGGAETVPQKRTKRVSYSCS